MVYHRQLKMWLKATAGEQNYTYFNIQSWKFTDLKGELRPEDACSLQELQ